MAEEISENPQKREVVQVEEEGISLMELLHIVKIRFWIVILFVVLAVGLAVGYLAVTVPTYESKGSALVSPIMGASSLDSLLGGMSGSNKIQTEVSLITSESNLDKALALLDLGKYKDADGIPYDQLESPITGRSLAKGKKVTVSTVKDTNVVTVTVADSNPAFCQDLCDAIIRSFSDLLTDIARNSKTAQKEFLAGRMDLNEDSLKAATAALTDFKQKEGILQLSEKIKIISANVSKLQLQLEPLGHQKEEQTLIADAMSEALAKGGSEVPAWDALAEDGEIAKELGRIYDWNIELLMYQALGLADEDSSASTRKYVLASSISDSQKNVRKRVDAILKEKVGAQGNDASAYAQAVVQLMMIDLNMRAITDTKDAYIQELADYPAVEREAEMLSRNVAVYQALGMKLMEMSEETKLMEAAISGYVTPVDPANLPLLPVRPNKLLILAASVLLGGFLGVLLTLYVNHRDVAIHDTSTIKDILGPQVPELGWVPLLNDTYRRKYGSKAVSLCVPDSFATERLSVVASNVLYSTSKDTKVIGVNSASKGEGKSSLLANLAIAYATMGKKVLIIDGDLRRPSTERLFGIKKVNAGLSDMVVKGLSSDDVVVIPSSVFEDLHLLCAGHVTKNPTMIFNSKAFRNFLARCREEYDIVLVDVPPVSVSPEFATICGQCDGIIVNVRAGITSKPELALLLDNLKLIGSKLVGYVYYGVIIGDRESAYGSYGKGGYRYGGSGYGYGHPYSYDKTNYGKARRSSDLKILVSSRHPGRIYRSVYESELEHRDLHEKNRGTEVMEWKAKTLQEFYAKLGPEGTTTTTTTTTLSQLKKTSAAEKGASAPTPAADALQAAEPAPQAAPAAEAHGRKPQPSEASGKAADLPSEEKEASANQDNKAPAVTGKAMEFPPEDREPSGAPWSNRDSDSALDEILSDPEELKGAIGGERSSGHKGADA